ncbi:hypothetical protein QQP08_001342 [Theobroma cacao]|nr:hypothetical protein QQP08_001342 [Theobroma cacao]
MALKEASATSPSSSCSPYPTKFGCFLEPSETIEKRLKSCRFYWEYAIIILSGTAPSPTFLQPKFKKKIKEKPSMLKVQVNIDPPLPMALQKKAASILTISLGQTNTWTILICVPMNIRKHHTENNIPRRHFDKAN